MRSLFLVPFLFACEDEEKPVEPTPTVDNKGDEYQVPIPSEEPGGLVVE